MEERKWNIIIRLIGLNIVISSLWFLLSPILVPLVLKHNFSSFLYDYFVFGSGVIHVYWAIAICFLLLYFYKAFFSPKRVKLSTEFHLIFITYYLYKTILSIFLVLVNSD